MAKFKQEVLDHIKSDTDLFADVAKAMKIRPGSLISALERNSNTLNQFDIVVLVASKLGREPEELLEKESTEEHAQETK